MSASRADRRRWRRALAQAAAATLVLTLAVTQPAFGDAELRGDSNTSLREASFNADLSIAGTIARVRTRQVIINRSSRAQAASYRFELPDNAAVVDVKLRLSNGRTTTAEVVATDAATHRVAGAADLRRRGARPDPGLLRLLERDMSRAPAAPGRATYELRTHPLAARGSVQVEITWIAPMLLDDGRLSLRIPGRGDAGNLVTTRASIRLATGQGISGYDQLVAGGRLLARKLTKSSKKAYTVLAPRRGDLVVEVAPRLPRRSTPQVSFATVPISKNLGALAVQGWAPRATGKAALDHDRLILVVDVSSSMGPTGIDAARHLTQALLGVVPAEARIDLITYHRSATQLFGKLRASTSDNRQRIASALMPAPGRGNGSDLGAALDLVAKAVERDERRYGKGRTLVAIFTDGMLPLDLQGPRAVERVGQRVLLEGQVLAVSIVPEGAPSPDTQAGFLASLAHRTGGRSIVIRQTQVKTRAKDLAAELTRPIALEGLTLKAGATQLWGTILPERLEPGRGFFTVGLYHGAKPSELTLVASASGTKTRRIKATRDRALEKVALPLTLLQYSPADLPETDPDLDPERDAAAKRATFLAAARKARVVSQTSALIALDSSDRFARERLAMTRKWGPQVYMRLPAEGEDDTLGAAGTGYSERTYSTPSNGASGPRATGTLDKAIIGRLIKTHVIPKARACYEHALKKNPQLAGALILYLELARGEVQWAEVRRSTFPGALVESCIADAGYTIQVPRVALGDDAESIGVVTYPLSFRRSNNQAQVGTGTAPPTVIVDPNAPL